MAGIGWGPLGGNGGRGDGAFGTNAFRFHCVTSDSLSVIERQWRQQEPPLVDDFFKN